MGLGRAERVADDAGGVWIITGWVVGCVLYAGVALAWSAGFSAAAPLVVIPAVLVVMVGAGNLISGRRSGRAAPRFNRPDPVPISSLRPSSQVPPASPAPDGDSAAAGAGPVVAEAEAAGEPGADR